MRRELIALGLFAAILIWQILLPGFIGIANNGDFSKISGRLCLAGAHAERDIFNYFESDYARDPKNCWDSKMPSAELAFARLASLLQRTFAPGNVFDIRWLGAIHVAGFLLAFWLWLLALAPLRGTWWAA